MDALTKPKPRRGGYRPNAGRPLGAKSMKTKLTSIATAEQLAAIKQIEADGPTDLAVLRQVRDFWMGIAGKEQADAAAFIDPATGKTGRPPDIKLIAYALDRAAEHAKSSAPYRHHKLNKVTIGGNVEHEHTVDHTVRIVVTAEENRY